MSIERAYKPWLRNPTPRVREIRPIRGFHLLALEGRIALSAALQTALADMPASAVGDIGSFGGDVQPSPAQDATARSRVLETDQRLVTNTSDDNLRGAVAGTRGIPVGVATNAGPPEPPPRESDRGIETTPQGPREPDLPTTPDPTLRIAQANVAEDGFDPGLLGPLAWTYSEHELLNLVEGDLEVEDPVNYTAGPSLSGLSAQEQVAGETGSLSYPDFLAAGAWRSFSFDPPILSQAWLKSLHDAQTVDAQNASIMAGTMPFRSLLSGVDLPDQTASDAQQRFAELGPLEQSSPLALVATLWTMPSMTPFSPDLRNQPGERGDRHLETAAPLASWNVYVMGLDHAFERSYRIICERLMAGAGTTPISESSRSELAGRSEWSMPMVPMASAESFGGGQEALPIGGRSQSDDVILAPETELIGPSAAAGGTASPPRTQRDSQRGTATERAIPASVPIVAVITGSTVIAGWLWARRASWPRHGEVGFSPRLRPRAWRVLP